MPAFDVFDRTYCVSLPNAERRAKMEAQFARHDITDVQYVYAERPPFDYLANNFRRNASAELGVSLSHVKAWGRAMRDGAKRPLFIEDDIEFVHDAGERIKRVGTQFKPVLYLGGHPREPVKATGDTGLYDVRTFSFAEAYSVSGEALPKLFEFWLDRFGQQKAMVDFIIGEFAAQFGGQAIYPTVTYQPPNWSHVSESMNDKTALVERGWRTNLPPGYWVEHKAAWHR